MAISHKQLMEKLAEENELRMKLDGLVCESHACLRAAQEYQGNNRDPEASLLMDAAARILSIYTEA